MEKSPSRSPQLCCQLTVSIGPRATIFHSGPPSSPLPPLPNHSLQSNSSKDLPILRPLPTQAEHTLSPTRLTAFHHLLEPHTHTASSCCLIYCCLCRLSPHPWPPSTSPTPSLTSCSTLDISSVLTGLLSKFPKQKGKRAHCLVETTGIPNNSSWRVISLDHHRMDILMLIFT